ncbi:MAG TPA: hypothetical protein DCX54_00555 [Flavobacteriales bacterium]|nr:hypothetical protein [Flavobacteriales bacterium]
MVEAISTFHQKLKDKGFFHAVYLLSLVAFAVGILYSRALLSMSQMGFAGAFLLEGGLIQKARRIFSDKIALILIGIYLLHVVGLLFSNDFGYAWQDLRIKAPLLIYPVIFAGTNFLTKEVFQKFNVLFILLVFSRTLAILGYYLINIQEIRDMREAFFLISHIRFSLILCLSIMLSAYHFINSANKMRIVYIFLCLWFLLFMIYFELITGIFIVLLCIPVVTGYILKRFRNKDRLTKWIFYGGSAVLIAMAIHVGGLILTFSAQNSYKPAKDLEFTSNHRPYQQLYKHDRRIWMKENGHLIYQNVCFEELESQWNSRSTKKINYANNEITATEIALIRYLASKGMTKDSASVATLTSDEIKAIERGILNADYIGAPGYKIRIHKIVWELDNYFSGGDFNGHSSAMRLEFWKTGWHIIQNNFWTGVGTGDQENAFLEQYEKDNSRLREDWRFRAHNQYISMTVAFGIFGFLYFLSALFIPLYRNRKDLIYLGFMLITLLSMFTEDTLDTQIGVSFFAFFNCYFLFRQNETDVPQSS